MTLFVEILAYITIVDGDSLVMLVLFLGAFLTGLYRMRVFSHSNLKIAQNKRMGQVGVCSLEKSAVSLHLIPLILGTIFIFLGV